MNNPIEAFKQAMTTTGIEPPAEIITDGVLHRFTLSGDKPHSKNGWYVFHNDDLAAGTFGDWKRDISETWHAKSDGSLNTEEKARYKASIELIRRQREEEQERGHAECRKASLDLWSKASEVNAKHPYLIKKGIKPKGIKQLRDILLIPVKDYDGTMHGLQIIKPDGSKKFKTGSRKTGNFCRIPGDEAGPVLICEGYATGASLNEATGYSVAVAFDAGNLGSVAKILKERLQKRTFIVCADNDRWKEENVGLTKAKNAALEIGAKLAIPVFKDTATKPTDFNDLHLLEGLAAVKDCIKSAATEEPLTAQRADLWPDPLPLPEGLPPVKPLDPDMIPEPLRGWLMDISDRMQIPPDFSTAAAVVALGSIIGRGCGIYPKRHDDWLVVPNLWGAVIGRPSLMKTPAITEAQRHLVRLETEARDKYQEAERASGIDKEIQKITRAAIGEKIKKAVKSGKQDDVEASRKRLEELETDEPVRRRFQTQDGTTEKIGELLNQNPRGLLINRDELIGWFHSLDKNGREGDRAFYLEAWNGTRGYTYDRIGRGTLDIDALCVSIFGAITPGPLSDYVYQASRGGNGDDGLLQRFQVMVWPDTPSEWRNVDRFPDTTEKNRAWEIFSKLALDTLGTSMVGQYAGEIPALRFSPTGQKIFDEWRHDLEARLISDHGLPPSLESHLAKYRSLMPSLALIFHLVEVVDGSSTGAVSETATLMAAAWCGYLESHACRVYGGAAIPGMESAREIVKRIRSGAIQDGCKPKDIYRNHWSKLATPEEVKAGLDVLTEYDWLVVNKDNTGGRPSEIVRLNPMIKL